jgi:curved DNA-binding protein CbpA
MLPARDDLTDDDVRAAWRRIAAATHPDRDDGGDPARFAAAAAAYATLRTGYGRGEALADLREPGRRDMAAASRHSALAAAWRRFPGGQPAARICLRLLAAGAASAVAVVAAGWVPATAGVLTGALTWLIIAGRHDIGAIRGSRRMLPGVTQGAASPIPGRAALRSRSSYWT